MLNAFSIKDGWTNMNFRNKIKLVVVSLIVSVMIGCQYDIIAVNHSTDATIKFDGGFFGGKASVSGYCEYTVKRNQILDVSIPIGDTLVVISHHNNEALLMIIENDTTINFDDVMF